MNYEKFKTSLIADGWTVTENQLGILFTNPVGGEFYYRGLEAVRFGTWFDVAQCNHVSLPKFKD